MHYRLKTRNKDRLRVSPVYVAELGRTYLYFTFQFYSYLAHSVIAYIFSWQISRTTIRTYYSVHQADRNWGAGSCQVEGVTAVSYTHLTLPTNREV